MDMPSEEDLGHLAIPRIDQGVVFRDVGLVYPDGRRALSGVTITADIGQIVAIAGPTGAGKTSLASLIPRYRVATEGEVLVDGVNVNAATLESLRGQVAYVFQETQLFSDSIMDNIRFGNPDASKEEVERVARTRRPGTDWSSSSRIDCRPLRVPTRSSSSRMARCVNPAATRSWFRFPMVAIGGSSNCKPAPPAVADGAGWAVQ